MKNQKCKVKVLILNGDSIINAIDPCFEQNAFIFLIVKKGKQAKVFHMDTSDGKLWSAAGDLGNLGKGHQQVIRRHLEEEI